MDYETICAAALSQGRRQGRDHVPPVRIEIGQGCICWLPALPPSPNSWTTSRRAIEVCQRMNEDAHAYSSAAMSYSSIPFSASSGGLGRDYRVDRDVYVAVH